MTAPAFPSGTFATEGRGSALVPDRGVGGQRQPPADGGGFADIISKLAAPPQARGEPVDGPAAARSSEAAPAGPVVDGADGRSAGPRADGRGETARLPAAGGTETPGTAQAAGIVRLGLPAAAFSPAAATVAASAASIDGAQPRPETAGLVPTRLETSQRPAASGPLATALADAALSASLAAGEPAEPAAPRHATDGARATSASPTAPHRSAWRMPVIGAAEAPAPMPATTPAETAATVSGRATTAPELGDGRSTDRPVAEAGAGDLDLSKPGSALPSTDPAAARQPDGSTTPVPPVVPTPGADAAAASPPAPSPAPLGTPTAAAPPAANAATAAGGSAPTGPAAALPAEIGAAEAPAAAAPEQTRERVTATVRDMRTHFAPVAPRRAPLPAEPTVAQSPAAGAAAPETGPDQAPAPPGPAPKPSLATASPAPPTAPATAPVSATPVAAAALPFAPAAPAGGRPAADGTLPQTASATRANGSDESAAAATEDLSPAITDRAGPAVHRDERAAPAHGGSAEPVRSREPAPSDADRRAAPTAGVTPTVETAAPAAGNGFPATLNALAKDIGEAARAAAAGPPAGPGQPAPSSGLAAAAPGAHALRRDVEIDLSSSELGVVKVRMRLTGTSLEVRLRTDDAATLALLADRRAELERSISESGVEARIVDVTRATTASGAAPPPGPGPQLPAGGDGREASGQRFEQGASPERQDHRRPGDDHQTYGTTSDEDQPHRTGPRAGTLFV